ncbi:MAG: proline--tRNA ligase, partial [Bacilli bacterium]|nr:proline--tRNA ligase [Bacilli bacterium]
TITTYKEVVKKPKELIETPGIRNVRDLSEYLDVFESRIVKSVIVKVDGNYKMILLKGASELNIKKVKQFFNTNNVVIPSNYELEKYGVAVGFIGPINTPLEIFADNEVKSMNNFICGSNKENHHYINANFGRDFEIKKFADLKLFDEKCLCPKCKNECEILDGIEVGQITKLGTVPSEEFKLTYTDEINTRQYVQMGAYTIGLDRLISAIVENNNDENGIIWPVSVAPFKVGIIVSNVNDSEISKYASTLYNKLRTLGIDTVLDDRKESIGIKFNDMDLIGVPILVTIVKKLSDSVCEVKLRRETETKDVKTSKIVEYIQNILEKGIS